jgi:hypothetical protein
MQRLIGGALALLLVVLSGADVLCALPCSEANAPVQPSSTAASHCQSASTDRDGTIVTPADSCVGEHGSLTPAEITARRAIAEDGVLLPLLDAVLPTLQTHGLALRATRTPDTGLPAIVPPLRI